MSGAAERQRSSNRAQERELSVTSTDGRAFRLIAAPEAGIQVGTYVRFSDAAGEQHLGFVEEITRTADAEVGFGAIMSQNRRGTPVSIYAAPAERCSPRDISSLLAGSPATMRIGRLVAEPDVGVGLVAKRLNRHTFWCGQSGSGKTYALGVALERILLDTGLPILIFDPNSDFVRLDEPRPGIDAAEAKRLAAADIRILRPGEGPDSLRVRFRSMTTQARAAILQLDPVGDRHEYNLLRRHRLRLASEASQVPELLRAEGNEGLLLAERLENLEILDWQSWGQYDAQPATDIVAERHAATVLDLGGFQRIEEQLAVALAVLDDLWALREKRRPVLIVIDEAHNLCAPEMESLLGRAVRDRIIQIAAEGRKFGLWLLISTQRPSKVHPQIVSQCDNLTLMRMNSPGDLDHLADIFGFVPRAMLAQSARFRQGEALVAGGFVAAPSIVQMRSRITAEGGIDVPVPMSNLASS